MSESGPLTPVSESDDIDWRGDTPFARRFEDIYYSPDDGLAESDFVFIKGIGAPDIWAGANAFTVAETGFGTGLNFLLTAQKWLETTTGRLTYISTEAYPLSPQALEKALSAFPSLSENAAELIRQWPPSENGFHSRKFAGGRITLMLLFGDAADSLSRLDARVDAWYLDGFAPAKNPAMWSDAIFSQMTRLSNKDARFATFTAAGFVKRGLEQAGFAVQKTKGFGRKRERLTGFFTDTVKNTRPQTPPGIPDWAQPAPSPRPGIVGTFTVIGDGIAGAMLAYSLKARGIDVTVIARPDEARASSVPLAMLIPKIPRGTGPARSFQAAAYSYMIQHPLIRQALSPSTPLTYHASDSEQETHFDKLVQDLNWGPGWFEKEGDALLLDKAATLNTAELLHALLADVPQRPGTITGMSYRDGAWHLEIDGEVSEQPTDNVILASGPTALTFGRFPGGSYSLSAGQVELLKTADNADIPSGNHDFNVHISDSVRLDGAEETRVAGSSFEPIETLDAFDPTQSPAARSDIITALAQQFNLRTGDIMSERSWRGVRVNTPDFMPYVGGVPKWSACEKRYQRLQKDALTPGLGSPDFQPGLYVMSGFGSKGYQYAPLCAEILAAQICGEAVPLPYHLWRYLAPIRPLIKRLVKG